MQKILIIRDYKNHRKGTIEIINENEAHTLIDGGYAKLYNTPEVDYPDKMLRPRKRK